MATERQSPDVLLLQTNLTGAVTDIDDDPDSPDGLWLTADSNNVNSICHTSFPTPTGNPTTGAGLQEFRSWIRVTPNASSVTFNMYLYENGTVLNGGAAIATTSTASTTGVIFSGTWNASLLGTANGSLVECYIEAVKSGGSPGARTTGEFGAVEWNVVYDPPATFEPAFDLFRFYNDGTEASAVALFAEGVNATYYKDDTTPVTNFQLRARIQNLQAVAGLTTDDYGLEYSKNGGAWTAITSTSSNIKVNTGSALTDGAATTNRLTAGTGSFVAGEQEEVNGVIEDLQITASNYTNLVWALSMVPADVVDDDVFSFRITLNGGAPGMTNSVVPKIIVMEGFVLDHREKFTVTFAAGEAQTTHTLVTPLTDKNKAFLIVGTRVESNLINRWEITWEITNLTTLTFDRSGTGVAVTLVGYVVEASSGMRVDHGELNDYETNNPTSANLSNVADISRAFIIASNYSSSATWDGDDEASFYLSDPAKINSSMNNVNAAHRLKYQVIQMSNILVQRGSFATWSTTSTTASISTVDRTKAFLIFNALHGNGAGDGQIARWRLRGRITSDVQLTFDRDDATSNINNLYWEVGEFQDGTTVQEINSAFASNGNGTDQTNSETISLTQTGKAIAFSSFRGNIGKGSYNNTSDGQIDSIYTFDITSVSNMDVRRDSSYGTGDVAVYVIEFEPITSIVINVPLKSFSKTGNVPIVGSGASIASLSKSFNVTKNVPVVGTGALVDTPSKSFVKTTYVPSVNIGVNVAPPLKSYTLIGQTPSVGTGVIIASPVKNYTVTKFIPTVTISSGGVNIIVPLGTFSLTGLIPAISIGVNINAPLKLYSIAKFIPLISLGVNINVPNKSFSLLFNTPIIGISALINSVLKTFNLNSFIPAINIGVNIIAPSKSFALTSLVPSVGTGIIVLAPVKNFGVTFNVPVVGIGSLIQVPSHSFVFSAYVPGISSGVSVAVSAKNYARNSFLPVVTATELGAVTVNVPIKNYAKTGYIPSLSIFFPPLIIDVPLKEFSLTGLTPNVYSVSTLERIAEHLNLTPPFTTAQRLYLVENFGLLKSSLKGGFTGQFTTTDGKTVLVRNGIITNMY